MSKRFLTKVAGGVALGSAALLLGAPAIAYAEPATEAEVTDAAATQAETADTTKAPAEAEGKHKAGKGKKGHDPKQGGKKLSEEDFKYRVKDKHGKVFQCAVAKVSAGAKSVVGDINVSKTKDSIVAIFPIVPSIAKSANNSGVVVCIRDLDKKEIEFELDDLVPLFEDANASVEDTDAVDLETLRALVNGLFIGKDGILLGGSGVTTPAGGVAAGDGGALSTTNSGALAAAGAGLLGAAALGGLGLRRRRAAHGTLA